VELLEREAADFSGFAPGEFDTIVLNSVVQYFPSGEYLLRVLEGAARLLAPGGAVFLGDVRSLPLLPAFYSSLELARSPGLSAAELDRRIEERLRNEEELAVSPELFPALSRRLPGLTSWSVRTKEGKIDNELSRYRYDVVLHFDPESPADPLDAPVRPWESFTNAPLAAGRDVLAELRGYLSAALPPAFVPSHWISLDSLPLNPNGKLDRGALPVPGGERSGVGGGFVAPRGGDESTIARIFAEVLGVDRVGARDGFFDLGGHSLLATQAIARLNSAFQTVLPLQTLFEKPTPEALAVELQALRCGGTAAGPSLLVPLRPEGTRPPLVLFHAAGGTVFRYAALARRLPTGWPVWGVRAQGAEGEAQPLDSIEAMADLYARELRTLASRGALTLAGWSLGGVVAYETARRLVHFGVSVAAVVLIDSRCPADDEPEVSAREAYARELGVAPAEVDPDQLGHSFRVFAANLAARSRWRPSGPVQGRLVLLRAAGSAPRVPGGAGDPTLGWGAAVENPIEAQEIPGTHVSILAEPHVETLAARLASLLGGHSSKGEIS
jgi:thioesterase domain-containing protein/acyl carrier protein